MSDPKVKAENNNNAPIMILPQEVHLNIIDHLSAYERTQLKCTNKHFNELIPKQDFKYSDLFYMENLDWVQNQDLLACALCVRLRQSEHFDKRVIWRCCPEDDPDELTRFCIDCSMKHLKGTRWEGSNVVFDRLDYWFFTCETCGKLGMTSDRACVIEECTEWGCRKTGKRIRYEFREGRPWGVSSICDRLRDDVRTLLIEIECFGCHLKISWTNEVCCINSAPQIVSCSSFAANTCCWASICP